MILWWKYNLNTIIPLNYVKALDEDKIRDICNKFLQKTQIDKNDIYFMYNGNKLNLDVCLSQIINKSDKERKIMSVLVLDNIINSDNKNIIKSSYIICTICKESARFKFDDYTITIYDCKNGHITNNISIYEFENTQLIDKTKIICNQCKIQNKSNTDNKEMFICNLCNMNICPLCRPNHDKNHNLIKYEQKYYICNIHNEECISYCKECKEEI